MSPLPSPVLIVSPHLDDAALSCAALLDAGAPVDVLTVLAGVPEARRVGWSERHMGFADSTATMTARRREEAEALEGSVRRLELMDLLDDDYLDGVRPACDAEGIRRRVRDWLGRNPGGAVALPAGAGRRRGRLRARLEDGAGWFRGALPQHADHLFVRDAALPEAIRAVPPAAVVLYEELPYLSGGSAEGEVRRIARRFAVRVEEQALPVDVARKAARIGRYSSQLAQLTEGPRLDDPASLPPAERYWILRRP